MRPKDPNELERQYERIKEKIAAAAQLVREAGQIADENDIQLGDLYHHNGDFDDDDEEDDEIDTSDFTDEELEAHEEALEEARETRREIESSLGNALEHAMEEAGWRTSAWGC